MPRLSYAVLGIAVAVRMLAAQTGTAAAGDAYTRYELLAPGSAKFRILYEVTAVAAGATHFFNPIRQGSIASNESVRDRATGQPLQFDVVGQDVASAMGVRGRDSSQQYIRVTLTRPVPANGGESRLLIDKTYEDAKSYYSAGDTIIFNRSLGIKRNAVVLPANYELIFCNYPAQILREADGRIGVAFWNNTPSDAALVLKAVPTVPAVMKGVPLVLPREVTARLDERAHQNRKIVYFLQQPETHAFDLYHDYTESRAGTGSYVNIVRTGSTASKPSARNLDTGEELTWTLLKGADITAAAPDEPGVAPTTEAVVFRFAAVKTGQSVRLRMSETYTDSARYRLIGNELFWDRTFGRPANTVVLPAGWWLTNSSIPATVSDFGDGRVRLDFVNPRTDDIAVLITAHRRSK